MKKFLIAMALCLAAACGSNWIVPEAPGTQGPGDGSGTDAGGDPDDGGCPLDPPDGGTDPDGGTPPSDGGSGPDTKVCLCHIPKGNPGNAHTICIGEPAVDNHLSRGDYLGRCTNGN